MKDLNTIENSSKVEDLKRVENLNTDLGRMKNHITEEKVNTIEYCSKAEKSNTVKNLSTAENLSAVENLGTI